MTKDHMREKLQIVEQKIEKLQREHDPTSMEQIASLEGLAAERCYLRSCLALKETDAASWRRQEMQARANQIKAARDMWAEKIRELTAKAESDANLAHQFEALKH